MALTTEQKVDLLLKKIGYTKTKTGSVFNTGSVSGTGKQPFGEAIPSPLIVANSSLWNEADSIPATPPGSDTNQVKRYPTTSAIRMTLDTTVTPNRSFIAYATYNNTSSARLTNWIDTQFGPDYQIEVYVDDPTNSANKLPEGGSGDLDGWYFDYSAGVLNFSDTRVPRGQGPGQNHSGVDTNGTNVYIVGYRYVGQTGAPTSGISTFSYLDLTVERNLDVGVQGGISTFRNNIDANGIIEGIAGENKIPFLYSNLAALPNAGTYHGMFAHVHSEGRGYFAHAGNWLELVNKDTSGNVGLSGDLDVDGHTELDNVNISGLTTAALLNVNNLTNGRVTYAGANGRLVDSANLTFNGSNLTVGGNVNAVDGVFSGNVSIGGTLTYEDVTNVDSVGLLTARSGIRVTGGVIEAQPGENKIPSLYANMAALPSASSYHGMFAHVHSTGRGYFAHAGNWLELVNKETNGTVGTGTETYNIGNLVSTSSTTTSLNVTGVTTAVTVDINGDLDVDGHTELDNVNIVGVTTFNLTNHPEPLKIISNNTSGNISTYLFTANQGFHDIRFEHNFGSNWNNHDHMRLIWSAPNESPTYPTGDLFSIQPRSGVPGFTYVEYKINDSSSGLVESYRQAYEYQQFRIRNSVVLNLNQQGIGVTNRIYHYGYNNDFIQFGHHNMQFHIGSATERRVLINNNRVQFDNLSNGVDINADLDVDGHTNLDNVSVAGVTTFASSIHVADSIIHEGDTDTKIDFNNNNVKVTTGNVERLSISGENYLYGSNHFWATPSNPKASGFDIVASFRDATDDTLVQFYNINTKNTVLEWNDTGNTTSAGNLVFKGVGGSGLEHARFTGSGNFNLLRDLDVDGHTNLDNVSIVGVTTAAGHVLPSADSTYDLGSSSKQWRNLYADNIVSAPGIGFIGPDLTVRNFKATGISTFEGNARFNSTIAVHDGTTGSNGQYLKSVGTGVTWASFPTLRTRQTFTASAGQTSFTFSYTVNFIDVFVNGIKLTDSEFTATNGTSVVLAVGCFVGDIVELVSYNTVSTGAGGGGGTLNNIVEDTTPQLGGNLDLFNKTINGTGNINITGVVTATQFKGDGSGLTGIVASGSGVVVKDGGSTVGTAGTINFGDNLSVSAISAGIVTITGSIGITTISGIVSIANDLDVDGHTNLDNVSVAGVTTFSDRVRVLDDNYFELGNGADLKIQHNSHTGSPSESMLVNSSIINNRGYFRIANFGNANNTGHPNANSMFIDAHTHQFRDQQSHLKAKFIENSAVELYHDGNLKFSTASSGINIVGTTTSTQLAITGVSTFTGNIDANGDLDVDGHTELDNVNIAGVVTAITFKGALEATSGTFSSNVNITRDLDVDGHTNLDNVSIAGVTTANTVTIKGPFGNNVIIGQSAGANWSGAQQCVAIGYYALQANTNSNFNTAVGVQALGALGSNSGSNYTSNTAVGHLAGSQMTTSSGNTLIGRLAGSTINSNNNTILGIFDGNQGGLDIRNSSNNVVIADGASNIRLHINASGNAGIGTTNPDAAVLSSNTKSLAVGILTAYKLYGDGSSLTGISGSGISTTHVRADTIVVGENTTGVSTFHRVQIPTNKSLFFGDNFASYISYPTSGYLDIYGGTAGDLSIRTGGNQDVHIEPSGSFLVKTNGTETAIRAAQNGSVELYNNNSSSSSDLRLRTTGVGVSVIGITSITDNLMVGTAATITPAGAAQFAGIVTASSFVGDGSGLTGIIASGSGIIIKEGGSTVGTAGTINFVGVDVSPASAGIVTVSTATTSITDGNSKLFVNNVSSSNGNGSFEVFLNEFTSSGTAEALNMHQPSDGYARIDLFHGSTPQTIEVNAKTVYSGYARHRLKFETNNASYGGQLDFLPSVGQWNFYSTYQGAQKQLMGFNYNTISVGTGLMYPITNNGTDLGSSSYKWRQFHVTGVNAGVVTATTYHGDGSNLTGISGGTNVGITTNLSGTFTASAGSPSTINTFAYHDNDKVVEYTVYIKNGSNFQSQKLLAMRDGTTIHSTQFAVMFSSSLIVQCDATISSGNILLRATPESGVSGSTTYKVKREVM